MTVLPDKAKRLLDAPEFVTIATLNPDGQPQLSVVWAERDGDDVLVSTVKGRQKHRNLERDPKVTVLVCPKDSPYEYAEIRGVASMTEEGGRALIDRLALAYRGWERYPADDGTDNVRVVVRISPTKVVIR